MWLILSGLLFAAFVGNVSTGAFTGTPLLSDVQEMLLLFSAAVFFVVAILRREAREKNHHNDQTS